MEDPITLHRYRHWAEAQEARDYLKRYGVEAFIFFTGPLPSSEGRSSDEVVARVQLVSRMEDADRAADLLEAFDIKKEAISEMMGTGGLRFYRNSAWMVSVFSIFYIVSFFVRGSFAPIYLVPAGIILLIAALFFFHCMYKEKREASKIAFDGIGE